MHTHLRYISTSKATACAHAILEPACHWTLLLAKFAYLCKINLYTYSRRCHVNYHLQNKYTYHPPSNWWWSDSIRTCLHPHDTNGLTTPDKIKHTQRQGILWRPSWRCCTYHDNAALWLADMHLRQYGRRSYSLIMTRLHFGRQTRTGKHMPASARATQLITMGKAHALSW